MRGHEKSKPGRMDVFINNSSSQFGVLQSISPQGNDRQGPDPVKKWYIPAEKATLLEVEKSELADIVKLIWV
jgi:hypothetical protein